MYVPLDLISYSLQYRIFAAADAPIDWEPVDVSPVKHSDGTMGIPKAAIDSVNKNKVIYKNILLLFYVIY